MTDKKKDKNIPKKILKEHQQAMILPADKKNPSVFPQHLLCSASPPPSYFCLLNDHCEIEKKTVLRNLVSAENHSLSL